MASQWETPSYVGNKRISGSPPATYSGMPANALPLNLVPPNLTAALHGELPEDVKQMLAQRAAELGVGSGTSGSQFNNFRSLRDLGLTSLQRQDEATKMLLPQFLTPYQSATLGLEHRRQTSAENEAFQNRLARTQGRMPGGETSAPLYQPPQPHVPVALQTGRGADPMASVNNVVNDLFRKYGMGGGGGAMAPMGSGTIPNVPGSWAGAPSGDNGGFYAGSAPGYDAQNLQQLVDLGVADPSWGFGVNPSSTFTGDVSGYDEYANYS